MTGRLNLGRQHMGSLPAGNAGVKSCSVSLWEGRLSSRTPSMGLGNAGMES